MTQPRVEELVKESAESLINRLERHKLSEVEAMRLKAVLDARMQVSSEDRTKDGFLQPDGMLRFVRWADSIGATDKGQGLWVDTTERPQQMAGTKATGQGLVTNGFLGVDLIRCPAGAGFAPHTHPGDHLLIVVAGEGTITYDGRVYPSFAGQVYMIEGAVPHAVGAVTDHCILAVGAPHKAVDSNDRQQIVEYHAVLAELGDMTCLICDLTAKIPVRLSDLGCPHDPTLVYPEGWTP